MPFAGTGHQEPIPFQKGNRTIYTKIRIGVGIIISLTYVSVQVCADINLKIWGVWLILQAIFLY